MASKKGSMRSPPRQGQPSIASFFGKAAPPKRKREGEEEESGAGEGAGKGVADTRTASASVERGSGVPSAAPRRVRRRVAADSDEESDAGGGSASAAAARPSSSMAKRAAGGEGEEAKAAAAAAADAEDAADDSATHDMQRAKAEEEVAAAEEREDEATPSAEAAAAEDDDDAASELLHEPDEAVRADSVAMAKRAGAAGKYDPVGDAGWKEGEKVPYTAVAHMFSQIEAITGRLKILEILCCFFRSVIALTPQDLLPCVYLCCNKIAPAFEGVEVGVGDALLIKSITEATGRTMASVKAAYAETGDLGLVAEQSRTTQKTLFKPQQLTVRSVFDGLRSIASMAGTRSQDRKVGTIRKLLVACQGSEARYVVRALQGKLRIGLADSSVLIALAHAMVITPPTPRPIPVMDMRTKMSTTAAAAKLEAAVATLKQVFSELPSFDRVVPALLEAGLDGVHERCRLTPGIPVHPMLAKPTKGVTEVLDRLTGVTFTCEYKYDGERAQIHLLADGTVRIFSRNLEDHTGKYPDIIQQFMQCVRADVTSFILDAEVVAYDRERRAFLPFQVLSTRSRKDVAAEDVKVKVVVMGFDMLFLNGQPLLTQALKERRQALYDSFLPVPHLFDFATHMEASDPDEITDFLAKSVTDGCEGLMVKTLEQDATYEPSKRSLNWLKLKKDYMDGMADSLDLVPIGAYIGRGKRTGVFGAYLLACYDPDEEELQTVCKIGTGFSDAALQEHYAFFRDKTLDRQPPNYVCSSTLVPDVWLDAVQVWEVKAADLSISPHHKAAAGKVDGDKGIALRFPRFIRIRDDKSVEQATAADQVADMYNSQHLKK